MSSDISAARRGSKTLGPGPDLDINVPVAFFIHEWNECLLLLVSDTENYVIDIYSITPVEESEDVKTWVEKAHVDRFILTVPKTWDTMLKMDRHKPATP